MVDSQNRGLFALPPELRLEIYRRLLASCLADGYIANSRGLIYSCTTILDEIRELCKKAKSMICLQIAWNLTTLAKLPLRIYYPPTYTFSTVLTDVTLHIPICNAYDPRNYKRSPFPLHCTLLSAFHLSLSTLTIKYYYPPSTGDVWWRASIEISSISLGHTYALTYGQRPRLSINRLMIDLGTFGAPPSPLYGTGAKQMNEVLWMKGKLQEEVKRWWIGINRTTPNPAWTICLDLVEGLPPLVNDNGRRWMLVEHIPDQWRDY